VRAEDWPQFGGLNRDNISPEKGLADEWPATGPKVLWETEVHGGYSGLAIKGGKAYLLDRNGDVSLLRCLDMESGKLLWEVSIDDPGTMNKKYDGTRGTPTVTDDAVYFVTGCGTFACVDLTSKEVMWKHSLTQDYNNELHKFGIAQSPSLYGNMVLVAPNSKEVGVAAYDQVSGERLWVSPGLGSHTFISPRVETVCGEDMVIAVGSPVQVKRGGGRRKKGEEKKPEPKKEPAPGHVVGLSPRNGSILWDYTDWECQIAIPHPVALPGNHFFITGGYNAGSAMIQLVKNGDGF
jgi:outer membrane protein assembly factor BamB